MRSLPFAFYHIFAYEGFYKLEFDGWGKMYGWNHFLGLFTVLFSLFWLKMGLVFWGDFLYNNKVFDFKCRKKRGVSK